MKKASTYADRISQIEQHTCELMICNLSKEWERHL